eukprot:346251_1
MSGVAFPVRCVPPFRAPPHVHASAMKLEFSYDTAANNSCLAQLPEVTCDLYCRARPVDIAAKQYEFADDCNTRSGELSRQCGVTCGGAFKAAETGTEAMCATD